MSNIIPFQAPRPPDWRELCDWLLSAGPKTLSEIALRVQLSAPGWSEADLERKLSEKRGLFRLLSDARWSGLTREVYWVPVRPAVRPRPRPPRPVSTKPKPSAPAPPPKPARKPESTDPFRVVDGELVSVMFTRDSPAGGEPYESGGRLLLPLPQEAEASDIVRPAILAAAEKSAGVEVWEVAPGADPIFRGTRALLQAAPSPVTGRVNLIFESAGDDEGRRRAPRDVPPLLLPPGTHALTIALPELQRQLQLTESQRKLASLAPATRTADRAGIFKRAAELLRLVGVDSGKPWNDFCGWLATNKPKLDQGTLEQILRMAINTPGVPREGVLRLAATLLEERTPVDAPFARDFAVALLEHPEPALLPWAKSLLLVAVAASPADPELQLAQASLAMEESSYALACHWFETALIALGAEADPLTFEEYLLSAVLSADRSAQDTALSRLDAALQSCETSIAAYTFRAAISEAISLEQRLGRKDGEHVRTAGLLRLLVEFDERSAVKEWETRCIGEFFKVSEKLELLSILEDCESQEAILCLGAFLEATCREALTQKNESLQRQALIQLRFVETLLGDDQHRDSTVFELELAERKVTFEPRIVAGQPAAAATPRLLQGKVIAILGGSPRSVARIRAELESRGAEVREVPPSSESQVNTRKVKDRTATADIVAAITDFTGHDLTDIARALKSKGAPWEFVPARFGPSLIVADIVAAAARSGAH